MTSFSKLFFDCTRGHRTRAQQLALALATRSKLLRDYLGEELVRQEREHKEGRLYGLFQIFRDQVFHELTLREFADAFAQMLAYGLFLARLNSNSQPITLNNAREYVPGSFRLIRELVDFLTELEKNEYRDVRSVVEEVLSIVNGLDLPAIHNNLSFRHRKAINRNVRAANAEEHRLFERDPFIYFYEDYLRAYDKETSKSRGVYYTPPPVVNFIVRAVDDILKVRFDIRDGLADNQRVTVLDFACGIHFARQDLLRTVRNFIALDAEDARSTYSLGKDVQDWKVAWAQEDVRASGPNDNCAVPILYRPFDTRWTYFTGKSSGFLVRPRPATMHNMLRGDNIGLITSRLTKGETFQHAQVTDHICEVICMSPKTSNNGFLFPLHLCSDDGKRSENLSLNFRAFLDTRYEHHYTPEEILGYIYAILHAPTYRNRYAEFLRIDFPRVPFPELADDFEKLSKLGWALVQAHLLHELPRKKLADYFGKGDHTVESVRYSAQEKSIWINKTQSFKPVPQDVWDFHIGGYQVLDKYLKSRKGRALSLDEINHVAAIADSLAFTIEQMAKIDEAYQTAFAERG